MPAPTARLAFLPDVLEEHLEELGFLWGRRAGALRSAEETPRTLRRLDERIQAHLQGVLAVGERGLDLIAAGLDSDDPLAVFSSAFSLLHLRRADLAHRVVAALAAAQGPALGALRDALAHAPNPDATERLGPLLDAPAGAIAVAAAEALAFRGVLRLSTDQIGRFLADPDPAVRVAGWRLAGYLGPELSPKTYAAALRDEDAAVASAALWAGAWCRLQGVLPVTRQMAAQPAPERLEDLRLLAILAGPADAGLFRALADDAALGPGRFRLLGALGNASLMELVLRGMEDADPAAASAAGAAFAKITGESAASSRTATIGGGADAFEAEFAEEVALPDPERARRAWERLARSVGAVPRLCRGLDMGRPIDPATFAGLDMETRTEMFLRSRFHGAWGGSPLQLEAFPLRFD
ncbi:MAG TPA: hypothetical protein VFQ38_19400 [Longimicrobiales bacterium]|nr:hypothetical protein [Longimicrobiales bacterium]